MSVVKIPAQLLNLILHTFITRTPVSRMGKQRQRMSIQTFFFVKCSLFTTHIYLSIFVTIFFQTVILIFIIFELHIHCDFIRNNLVARITGYVSYYATNITYKVFPTRAVLVKFALPVVGISANFVFTYI